MPLTRGAARHTVRELAEAAEAVRIMNPAWDQVAGCGVLLAGSELRLGLPRDASNPAACSTHYSIWDQVADSV